MLKVLLVDDESSIRLTMAEFFRREGFEARLRRRLREPVASSLDAGLDLAVVDINLPGRSGIELLQDINSASRTCPSS